MVGLTGLTSSFPSTVEIENLVIKIQIMLPQCFHYGRRMKKTKTKQKTLPFASVMLIELSQQHSILFLLSYPLPAYVYSEVTYFFTFVDHISTGCFLWFMLKGTSNFETN